MEMKNDHDGYLMLINRDRAGQKVVIFDMMMLYMFMDVVMILWYLWPRLCWLGNRSMFALRSCFERNKCLLASMGAGKAKYHFTTKIWTVDTYRLEGGMLTYRIHRDLAGLVLAVVKTHFDHQHFM